MKRLLKRFLQRPLMAAFPAPRKRALLQDLHKLYKISPDLICIMDFEGTILTVNPAVFRILGYRPEEFIGHNMFEFVHPEDASATMAIAENMVYKATEAIGFDNRYRRKDGSYVDLSWTAAIDIEAGRTYAIAKDVTEQRSEHAKTIKHEANLQALMENSPDIIWSMDRDYRVTTANAAFADLFERLSGRTMQLGEVLPSEAFSSELQDTWQSLYLKAFSGERVVYTQKAHTGEGQIVFEHSFNPIRQNGEVIGVSVFGRDITEHWKAEEKLRTSEAELREAQRLAKMGSFSMSLPAGPVVFSDSLKDILEIPKNKPVEMLPLLRRLNPGDWGLIKQALRSILALRTWCELEPRVYTPLGEELVLWLRMEVREGPGSALEIHGLAQDITERKRTLLELMAAKESAELAGKAKSDFLSTMSHEIRTPLNAVIGLAHLLIEEYPRSDQVPNLKALEISAANLLSLVSDILDFSKIEAGRIQLESRPFNLKDLLSGIIQAHSPKAREKRNQLRLLLPDCGPWNVVGDSNRLSQVLSNLLGNAIKFTNHGDVHLEVLRQEDYSNHVLLRFSVSDTGIGIPEDKQGVIFEKFSQASSDTTRKYGGTGLGLSIVKGLLHLMGSEISVTSRPGQGATFTFELSLGLSGKPSDRSSPLPVTSAPLLNGMRILMAEDNPMNILVAEKMLTKWGARLAIAKNGREAVAMAEKELFDLILMDLQMPEMDGFEAATRIKTGNSVSARCPILALTASNLGEIRQQALHSGIDDLVSKPFVPNDFRAKLYGYMKRIGAQGNGTKT